MMRPDAPGTSVPGRILFLAHRPLTDAAFGGGQRTSHLRAAAGKLRDVDTLVILPDSKCSRSTDWDEDRSMTFAYRAHRGPRTALADVVRVRRWVNEVLAADDYDLVIARYLSTALMVPRRYRKQLVLDADDILKTHATSIGSRAGLAGRAVAAVRRVLVHRLLSQVAHVWFVSPRDLAALGHRTRGSALLPNAAITYDARPRHPQPNTLMIVGHYAHGPNQDAVDFFIREVLPGLRERRPGAVLHIVGSVPDECADRWSSEPQVKVLGFVEDLGAEYARSALAVVPVHSGGGTQIKLIEALSNSCPTVASQFAYAGFSETLAAERHLYVARTADEWVDACLHALEDPERSESMAQAASDIVRRTYGVPAIHERIRQTLLPLLLDSTPRADPGLPPHETAARHEDATP